MDRQIILRVRIDGRRVLRVDRDGGDPGEVSQGCERDAPAVGAVRALDDTGARTGIDGRRVLRVDGNGVDRSGVNPVLAARQPPFTLLKTPRTLTAA